MENKSAEEVLKKSLKDNNCTLSRTLSNLIEPEVTGIYEAMKEYAQQEAVEFAEWKEEKTKLKYSEEYDGYVYMVDGVKKPVLDLSQLYQQFLTDKNK